MRRNSTNEKTSTKRRDGTNGQRFGTAQHGYVAVKRFVRRGQRRREDQSADNDNKNQKCDYAIHNYS
jgi:hypothetical protein